MVDTNGWEKYVSVDLHPTISRRVQTHDLKLHGHKTEVDDLHGGPEQVVCFEGRDVDILEFLHHGAFAASFGDGHEGEEDAETWRG